MHLMRQVMDVYPGMTPEAFSKLTLVQLYGLTCDKKLLKRPGTMSMDYWEAAGKKIIKPAPGGGIVKLLKRIKLTRKLKRWLRGNKQVKKGSPDPEYRRNCAVAICEELLTDELYKSMTGESFLEG